MIKVIEDGIKRKRIRCADCDCLFSYEKEDIKYRNDGWIDVFGEVRIITKYVICPQCKNMTIIERTRDEISIN